MSEAMAAPECDHFYVSHLHRGMYVRVCNLCNHPDWDDLSQQFDAVRAQERAARDEWARLYREAVGLPPSEHQARRLEQVATELERVKAEFARLVDGRGRPRRPNTGWEAQ